MMDTEHKLQAERRRKRVSEWFEAALSQQNDSLDYWRADRWRSSFGLEPLLILSEHFPQIEEFLHGLLDEEEVLQQVSLWQEIFLGAYFPTEVSHWVDALGTDIFWISPAEAHALYVLVGRERFRVWAEKGITVKDLHWVLTHCNLSPRYPKDKSRDFPIFDLLYLAEDQGLIDSATELKHLGLMFVALCQESHSNKKSTENLRTWRCFVLDWWAALRCLPAEERTPLLSGGYLAWARKDFRPEELLAWLEVGIGPNDFLTAKSWKDAGFSPAEFKEWVDAGWPHTRAVEAMHLRRDYYGRGYSVREMIDSAKLCGAFSGAFLDVTTE